MRFKFAIASDTLKDEMKGVVVQMIFVLLEGIGTGRKIAIADDVERACLELSAAR